MAASEAKEQVAVILAAGAVDDGPVKWGGEPAPVAMPDEFRAVFEREITSIGGRIVDMAGDGFLAVLVSAVGAVRAAVMAQAKITALVEQLPEHRKLDFRVGIHFGSILETADGDIEGDGVEVVKLMEGLAVFGGVTVSRSVYESAHKDIAHPFEFIGEHEVEGIADPIGAYRIDTGEHARSASANDDGPALKKRVLPLTAAVLLTSKLSHSLGLRSWPSVAAAAVLVVTISGIAAWQISATPKPEPEPEPEPAAVVEAVEPPPDVSVTIDPCVSEAGRYLETVSPAVHLVVRDCLESAVALDPAHMAAWEQLAQVYLDEHRFGLNARPGALDRAMNASARAASLDVYFEADAEWARMFRLKITFHKNATEAFLAEARHGIALNRDNSLLVADLGSYMVFAGEAAYGRALVQEALALNPEQPGWHRFSLVAYHYLRGEYEQALDMALKIDMPDFYWSHMYLAAIYGQLDRHPEAREAANRLLQAYPGFPESFWAEAHKWNAGMRHFVEGLRKAGLEIPDERSDNS